MTLLLGDWWGSGIVHAKVWISDGKDMYIGSANNDWKSLTQVLICNQICGIVIFFSANFNLVVVLNFHIRYLVIVVISLTIR